MTNSTLQKQMFQAGSIFAGLAVIAGAFGSHGLKDLVKEADLETFETAVRYHFFHALALLIIAIGTRRVKDHVAKFVFATFVIGIFAFSGSLYLLVTSALWSGRTVKWFGMITPFGGVSFVAGWLYLGLKGYKPSTGASESAKKVMEMQRRKTPAES